MVRYLRAQTRARDESRERAVHQRERALERVLPPGHGPEVGGDVGVAQVHRDDPLAASAQASGDRRAEPGRRAGDDVRVGRPQPRVHFVASTPNRSAAFISSPSARRGRHSRG